MAMKAAHSANTKGMTGRTRSHIVSRLEKGARIAEKLAQALSDGASGASPTDILDARAYAALLRGAALFEKQNWGACLKSYAICRIIYTALATSSKGDIFKELLSDTIDPSMRFAAYQAKIPRTLPIATIAHRAFEQSDAELVDSIKTLNPAILEQGDIKERKAAEGAPTTLTWRGRQVKIEDAVISAAWGAVGTAKEQLAQKLASSSSLRPKEMAAAYDDILIASQDAVDATKQAIDELKAEGVAPSDPRMQSLQITRTAVNYEMISWRIGRNRVLAGERDGAKLDLGAGSKQKKRQTDASSTERRKYETPGRQIARLKEKVVLYDGILQNVESIKELPGIANDEELSARLDATSKYFTALKCVFHIPQLLCWKKDRLHLYPGHLLFLDPMLSLVTLSMLSRLLNTATVCATPSSPSSTSRPLMRPMVSPRATLPSQSRTFHSFTTPCLVSCTAPVHWSKSSASSPPRRMSPQQPASNPCPLGYPSIPPQGMWTCLTSSPTLLVLRPSLSSRYSWMWRGIILNIPIRAGQDSRQRRSRFLRKLINRKRQRLSLNLLQSRKNGVGSALEGERANRLCRLTG